MNVRSLAATAKTAFRNLITLNQRLQAIQTALGRIELELKQLRGASTPEAFEFQVFSQWGDDGIIQFLIRQVAIPNPSFVEFGVSDYHESNTRFLLVNDGWKGLVIDCSDRCIEDIRQQDLHWKHDLTAVRSFITRDNIDGLIAGAGFTGDIGLLSIDIDGNDYWILEAITCVQPRILIVEYNSLFGPDARITIPYDPAFDRQAAHPSRVYYGASIAALESTARRKGYTLICSNRAGNNLYFVRSDLMAPGLTPRTAQQAYVEARFRESRDPSGRLTFASPREALSGIQEMPVVDLDRGATVPLKAVLSDRLEG